MDDKAPPKALETRRDKTARRFGFLINLTYFGVMLTLAFLVIRYLFVWMMPFVFAFLIAAMLQRPLRWLVKKTRVSRQFFSVVLIVLIILLLAALVGAIGWSAVVGIGNFLSDSSNMEMLQTGIQNISGSIQGIIDRLSATLSPEWISALNEAVGSLSNQLTDMLSGLFGSAAKWMTAYLPSLFISFVIWIAASIFLSIDYDKVTGFLLRQVPDCHQPLVAATRDLCHNTVFKMLRAYGLLMLLTFAELSAGFLILRIPYAIPLAALIAVVDILPVLGTGTVLIPWALICLIRGDMALFGGLVLLYIVITVVRNILEPRMVSHQIGLSPLVTLFFMFLGLKATGGLVGMLLFPIGIMILKQLQEAGYFHIWK